LDTLIPISDDWRPAETPVTPLEQGDRPAIFILAAIAALNVAIFLYVNVSGFVRQPYSDMFSFIRAEFDYERGGDLLAYLASPHNHQHLVWIRVLSLLDIHAFHGAAVIFTASAVLSVAVAALAISMEIWRAAPVRAVGALAALLSVLLIVSTVNAMDCTQPINTVYAFAFVFTVLAVILFEQAAADPRGRTAVLVVLSLVAALCAVGGSAAGVAVWPVLMFSAVRNPTNRRLFVPVLLVGLVAITVVLLALFDGAADPHAARGLAHVWKMAEYFVVYCGMPWSMIPLLSRVRLGIGLITLAVGAALLWRGAQRDGAAGRLERIGLDLMLFALITAAMAAVGRVDENDAVAVPVRYAIFMTAFQVGLVCLLALEIGERWAAIKRYAVPSVLAVAVILLIQQVMAGSSVLRYAQHVRAEVADFNAGVRRPEMHQLIFPDYGFAQQVQAECARRGLYQ